MDAFDFGPIAVTSEHLETVEPDGYHDSIRRNFDGPIYEYDRVRELAFTH